MQARRSIHPVAALIFLVCEAVSWIVGGTILSLAIVFINLLVIASAARHTKWNVIWFISITAVYGLALLSLIHGLGAALFALLSCSLFASNCSPESAGNYVSLREISGYFFRVLLPLSAVSAACMVVQVDQLSSQVVRWGLPLGLWRIICQTSAQVTELAKGAKEALVQQELTGRKIRSLSDRFSLLADLVTSIFYRGLLHSEEAHVAVSSRLQNTGRQISVVPMAFRTADFGACVVGLGIVLVALADRFLYD